jgi:3-dehydroquinate dehydratase type I
MSKDKVGKVLRIGKLALGKGPVICGVLAGRVGYGAALRAGRDGADMLELRVDSFAEADHARMVADVKRLGCLGLPLLLTVRSAKEGGARRMSDAERMGHFRALMPVVDAVDVELGSTAILKDVLSLAGKHGRRAIVSYHNFKATPASAYLKGVIRRARRAGADAVKIATFVRTDGDLKRLAGLLIESNGLIAIGMGERGRPSRVFFPLLGSLVTYGSTTVSRASSAPGQMSVKDLKRAFDAVRRQSGRAQKT